MAKARQEEAPQGAPDWIVTYGDLMSLLLTFFIMIAAMSEVKEEKFHKVLESIRNYLGYEQADAPEPGESPGGSLYELIRRIAVETGGPQHEGAQVNSVLGQNLTVQTVEEGYKITIGGKVLFDEGSAQLKVSAYEPLDRLVSIIKGYYNKLEIRGHTAIEPLPADSPYKDMFDLAFYRAKAVAEYLIAQNIDARRLRIQSGGPYDRPDSNLTYEGLAANRRVEVIVSEELVPVEGAGGN